MTIGLVGRKVGMTRVFTEEGQSIPVSVLHVEPNYVTQIKTLDTDGYSAIQIATGSRRANRITKPVAGHLAKAGVESARHFCEFTLSQSELSQLDQSNENALKLGSQLSLDQVFSVDQYVDVTGTSRGKGFAGAVKRHNFSMQDATHGNSLSHRALGSTGQNQTPGRVFKGKKMAGQMGNERSTSQSLKVVRIDLERQLLLVKGAVPGAPNGTVIIRPATKKARKAA